MTNLFGTLCWGGTYKGKPAVVGGYYGGASLYVFDDGEWKEITKGCSAKDVIPHKCKECGADLPMENVK